MIVSVATREGGRCAGMHTYPASGQCRQGRTAALPVSLSSAGPARSGPSSVPPRRGATSGALSRRRCCATRNSLFIRSRRCTGESPSSSRLSASIADAFGDCLIRSAPEASRHQRRHDGQAGHHDPVRNGVIPIAIATRHDRNRPGHEELRLIVFGEHETSVGNADIGPLFRIARCSTWRLPGRLARRSHGRRSVVKDDAQQRAVHLEPAVVFDQPELAELVHEEVHAGARRAHHFRERLL